MEIHQRPANRTNTGHFGVGVSSKNNRSEPPASRTAMMQRTKESRDEIATILTRSIHTVTSWPSQKADAILRQSLVPDENRPLHSSYKRGCQEKRLLPAPRRDAGVVTYIQPSHSRKGDGLAALARRRLQRRCQPQLLVVPTQRFHDVVVLDTIRFRSYAS